VWRSRRFLAHWPTAMSTTSSGECRHARVDFFRYQGRSGAPDQPIAGALRCRHAPGAASGTVRPGSRSAKQTAGWIGQLHPRLGPEIRACLATRCCSKSRVRCTAGVAPARARWPIAGRARGDAGYRDLGTPSNCPRRACFEEIAPLVGSGPPSGGLARVGLRLFDVFRPSPGPRDGCLESVR